MKTRNKLISSFLLLALMSSTSAIETPLADTDEAAPLTHFISRFQVFKLISFDFQQKNTNIAANQIITASGTVTFAPPLCFRWDYASKPKNIFASDGSWLMMVLPGDRQVMLDSCNNNPSIWSPISLLSDPNRIEQEFTVTPDSNQPEDRMRFTLFPKDNTKPFSSLIFEFQKDFDKIQFSLKVIDLAGNENFLTFNNFHSLSTSFEFLPKIPQHHDVTDFTGRPINLSDPVFSQLRKE